MLKIDILYVGQLSEKGIPPASHQLAFLKIPYVQGRSTFCLQSHPKDRMILNACGKFGKCSFSSFWFDVVLD